MLAAFKQDFRQELEQAMPGMVGRALTKSLAPIMKKQQEMADNQAQMRKDINLLREGQAKQSVDMAAQIAKLTEAVQAMSASGPVPQGRSEPVPNTHGGGLSQSQRAAAGSSAQHDSYHMDSDDGPHGAVVVLIFFPMDVGNTMMNTLCQQVMSKFATPAARKRAKPHIGQTETHSGFASTGGRTHRSS